MNTTHAVAGIDPHKRTATVAVVDVLGAVVTSLSFAVSKSGIAELLALLRSTSLSIDRVGVEGSGGLGRPVMLALAAAGYDVRESRPTAPPTVVSGAAEQRPMSRTPRRSHGRRSPTRTCRQLARTPPLHRHPTNWACCETGVNRLCCNVSGC